MSSVMSVSPTAVGKVSWEDRSKNPPKTGSFPIIPNDTVLVGRDDAGNHVAFADPVVSRCQLEIFSIVVDEEYSHPPLVFVRDRGSSNGTAVNGQIIAKGAKLSPSRLLEDGDVITIGQHPHLRLQYAQLLSPAPSYTLSHIQRQEVELFKNRYVIIDRTIGDGGHAVVFLAIEVETGQHVVCKVHDISRHSPTSKTVARICQEATLLSTLDHPNILPIKAAFETEQTIYVITELATGGDLFSLLLRYKRLDEWGIRSIIRQVLRGVAYIHSKGVAHRDIKPENILCGVTPQVPYRIMLSDFGDSGIAGPGPTRLKSAVGTRFYRAPECDLPGRDHDLSVDIWAVGMLTLQLFLGYKEFPGLDSVAVRGQREIDTYLGTIFAVLGPRGFISNAAESFICSCLAYDSGKRPTARQAFYHGWLQEPRSDRKMFKRLEAENASLWKPQQVKFPVIEVLTAVSSDMGKRGGGLLQEKTGLQSTVSPHFGVQEQGAAEQGHQTHREETITIAEPGSKPTTAIQDEEARAKRKSTAPDTESAKRPKSSAS